MLQSTAPRALTRRSLPLSRAFLARRHFQTSDKLSEKDTAFDPQETKPEEQKEGAAKELNSQGVVLHPFRQYMGYANAIPQLLVTQKEESPAHSPGSTPRNPQEGGSQGSKPEEGSGGSSRSGASGGGRPPKAGGEKSGGGGGT
jgi:uncharacterized membrane protein YgcG